LHQNQNQLLAFVVLLDKVCKIGRKAGRALLIQTTLRFFAGLLIDDEPDLLATKCDDLEYEPAFMSVMKLVDHVQTLTISRDQVRSAGWRSCVELAGLVRDRLKTVLGERRHSQFNLRLVKSMSAARIARREEKRQLVLRDPVEATKRKNKANQKKYRARKRSHKK
jgi:hypothetical protein